MPIFHTSPENSRAVAARISSAVLWAGVIAALLLGTATVTALAESSKSTKRGSGSAAEAAGRQMPKGVGEPDSGGMPGMMRRMMPGGPGGVPGSGEIGGIKKRTAKDRDSKTAEPADLEKLPPGYRVPQEPPEALTTTDEWKEDPFTKRKPLTQSTILGNYKTILASGLFASEDQRKLVADIVRWRLSLLTRKEFREQTYAKRQSLLQDISTYPSPQNKNNRDVRKFILTTIVEQAPELFKYHVIARINGAILLAELSDPAYNEADGDNRKPAEPCVRALEPLSELVNDKKQLIAPRIWGVNGLVRLAALPELKQVPRNQIVETLVKLLNESADEHEWYQWRLAEGLGKLNIAQNKEKPLAVPQALAKVLASRKRTWLVRSEAALSLGRLSYTLEIDAGLIAYEIALLAQQMAESKAYSDDPKLALWKLCFLKLYGTFKPLDVEQKRGLLTQTEKGPLASYRRSVQEAFDVVLPVIRKMVSEDQEGMETALAGLRKWLDANIPKNFKIHPDEEAIISDELVIKKPNAAGQGAVDIPSTANGGR
jgi:hypothetical protein